ncbi:MAG: membrane protein insertase YidC [Chromatiaceae bacterium]|nr:MAG: membrane protein insertase YidC [Chromatiaceae bacterium]
MDNMRLILIVALGAVLFLLYQAWQQDYGHFPAPPVTATTPVASGTAPGVAASGDADTPDAPPAAATPSGTTGSIDGPLDEQAARPSPITVETDVLRAEISPEGGTITSLWLIDYAQSADEPQQEFRLLKPTPPNKFIVQSGLLGDATAELPTHNTRFTAAHNHYQLDGDHDTLTVELHWTSAGIDVIRRLRFRRGSYVVEVAQEVINHSDAAVAVRDYNQLQRTELYDPNKSNFIRTYTGGVWYGPEAKYNKESFDDIRRRRLDETVVDGWVAMIQHYFMAAWIPPTGIPQAFYTRLVDDGPRYIIGMYSPAVVIPPGGTHLFENRLFVGPKLQGQLSDIAPGLGLTVDYGWLTILADPIFWLLSMIYKLVGNWGWAIIILTILIKGAFYKLSETSYKSMANLRKMAPRMQALKDRYGDDKERLNQAMMEMYKKEKINPLGGCLPILVQIPVFIALYWVLLESVELRDAPFMLWLNNLTEPDPYFILPLIMGVSMFVQQKLNPPPPDPVQAKIFMVLPIVFTVFFAFFPSGLVLYWTVNNLLSIAQQWYITRKIEGAARHGGKKAT